MTPRQRFYKRGFDLFVSLAGLVSIGWLLFLALIVAAMETRSNGIFLQTRVGYKGRLFKVIKIRTMLPDRINQSTVTVLGDTRITRSGRLFRRIKVDEFTQLINVFLGQMSLVGPRPDVPGYADRIQGEDCMILTVRPGITGPATLKYRNEEALLASVDDPERYNREVIWPDKVRINREYVENWSFRKDACYILQTIFGRPSKC